jgi:hypothetical protein
MRSEQLRQEWGGTTHGRAMSGSCGRATDGISFHRSRGGTALGRAMAGRTGSGMDVRVGKSAVGRYLSQYQHHVRGHVHGQPG